MDPSWIMSMLWFVAIVFIMTKEFRFKNQNDDVKDINDELEIQLSKRDAEISRLEMELVKARQNGLNHKIVALEILETVTSKARDKAKKDLEDKQ